MADLDAMEIRALTRIIDELTYYQILHLAPEASASEIKRAYHATSRSFHPDSNRHLDPALRNDCGRISKRVTEAYCVLRDPRRRKAYDEHISGGGGTRMQLAEARAAHAQKATEERQGRTPQGRQYHQKASEDMARGDWASAARNLQTALTFEPDSELFKELLAEAREKKKQQA